MGPRGHPGMLARGMNADAEALMEQALQHVLEETSKLLKRDDLADVKPIITALNELAAENALASHGAHERADGEILRALRRGLIEATGTARSHRKPKRVFTESA
jgi:hypothetical protein